MAVTTLRSRLARKRTWLHRWKYSLAVGFVFPAATLPILIIFQKSDLLNQILILHTIWLFLFTCDRLPARRMRWQTGFFSHSWVILAFTTESQIRKLGLPVPMVSLSRVLIAGSS